MIDSSAFPRITSGNAQADEILGGGFPANSINIVMGQPGTGKTIFVEQLLFHNATPDRPSLYVTTLSEPVSKVVSYVQRFSFFDADRLGAGIEYEDLGAALAERGPAALLDWLTDVIKRRSPKLIVVDSFRALHDLGMTADEIRRFTSRLAALLSAYDVTTFLVGEYTQEDVSRYPEFAIADAIIQLARQPLSTRDERFLRVLKLRGSAYREGVHAFRITEHGLQLYPRLVSPQTPQRYDAQASRVSTGVPGLDDAMGGGLFRGSTTLVTGLTGSGKTTLSLQFVLEGVRAGERVMFVNFQENPSQLRRALIHLGTDVAAAEAHGLRLYYASPVELQIDSIVGEIFGAVAAGGVSRLVIDALGDLEVAASDLRRVHDYLYSLTQHFAVQGVTTLLTLEADLGLARKSPTVERYSYMSDNVLCLGWNQDDARRRELRVLKMRGSAHEAGDRQFEITAKGLRLK